MSAVTADKTEKPIPDDLRLVTINENEKVYISKSSVEEWFMHDPQPVNDSVFKCSNCRLLTIHGGYEFKALSALSVNDEPPLVKRVYMCTNCGKFVSK